MAGGFGEFLGSIFANVAGAQDGVHVRIFNELKPWISNLLQGATRKWLPRIASGVPCEVPIVRGGAFTDEYCEHVAIAACDCCHRPVCLRHARIDHQADAICYICVTDAVRVVPPHQRARAEQANRPPRPPPPPRGSQGPQKPGPSPQEIAEAYRALGLKPTASWTQVQQAHRKLSAKFHPDRAANRTTPRSQAANEKRYVSVQTALAVLKTKYPEAA